MRRNVHRLDDLRIRMQCTWAEVGRAIGLSESMIYQVKSGARKLSPKAEHRLTKAERDFNISLSGVMSGLSEVADALGGKIAEESTFVQNLAALMNLSGRHPEMDRRFVKIILTITERQTEGFFGLVRTMAEWASKAASQIPDQDTALELKLTSRQVTMNEPEVREWLKLLCDSCRSMFINPPDAEMSADELVAKREALAKRIAESEKELIDIADRLSSPEVQDEVMGVASKKERFEMLTGIDGIKEAVATAKKRAKKNQAPSRKRFNKSEVHPGV